MLSRRIGIMNRHANLPRGLQLAAELGYTSVDYGNLGARTDLTNADHARAAGEARRLGLAENSLHARQWGFPPLGKPAELGEWRRGAEADLECAARLEAPRVAFHLGADPAAPREEIVRRNAEYFGPLAHRAAALGVRVCLENHYPNAFGRTVADLQAVAAAVRSTALGFTLDTGHALLAGQDPAAMARAYGPDLLLLHLHDNYGDRDSHRVPGVGNVDWPAFFAALDAISFAGPLNLELGAFYPEDDDYKAMQAGIVNLRFLWHEYERMTAPRSA